MHHAIMIITAPIARRMRYLSWPLQYLAGLSICALPHSSFCGLSPGRGPTRVATAQAPNSDAEQMRVSAGSVCHRHHHCGLSLFSLGTSMPEGGTKCRQTGSLASFAPPGRRGRVVGKSTSRQRPRLLPPKSPMMDLHILYKGGLRGPLMSDSNQKRVLLFVC